MNRLEGQPNLEQMARLKSLRREHTGQLVRCGILQKAVKVRGGIELGDTQIQIERRLRVDEEIVYVALSNDSVGWAMIPVGRRNKVHRKSLTSIEGFSIEDAEAVAGMVDELIEFRKKAPELLAIDLHTKVVR